MTAERQPYTATSVGKADDPLPPFEDHMIRQRVTRHGDILPLPPPEELPGCCMPRDQVGVVKVSTVRKWLEHKRRWDTRFKHAKARVHKKRLRDMAIGYEVFGEGEVPPPSALAGRRKLGAKEFERRKKARSLGLSLWALWGSKHDEMTVQREHQAEKLPGLAAASASQGQGARAFIDLERQEKAAREGRMAPATGETSRSRAWKILARGKEHGGAGAPSEEEGADLRAAGPVGNVSNEEQQQQAPSSKPTGSLSPGGVPETGVTGKRVMIGGLATPFSLRREPETASMITLATPMDQRSTPDSGSFVAAPSVEVLEDQGRVRSGEGEPADADGASREMALPPSSPTTPGEGPGLEGFVTAAEAFSKASA